MRKIRLTETELIDIIKKTISEQPLNQPEFDTKFGQSRGPGREIGTRTTMKPVTMDSSLFANGVDKINTQSTAYIEGINAISSVKDKLGPNVPLTVYVTGGASAVGSPTFGKEKNQALANSRARNFIQSAKKMFGDGVIFKQNEGVVGQETNKGPAADAEQFVKLNFQEPGERKPVISQATESTQLAMKNSIRKALTILPVPTPVEKEKLNKGKFITMCAEIPVGLEVEVQKFIDRIGGRLKSGGGYIGPRPGQMPGLNFK